MPGDRGTFESESRNELGELSVPGRVFSFLTACWHRAFEGREIATQTGVDGYDAAHVPRFVPDGRLSSLDLEDSIPMASPTDDIPPSPERATGSSTWETMRERAASEARAVRPTNPRLTYHTARLREKS